MITIIVNRIFEYHLNLVRRPIATSAKDSEKLINEIMCYATLLYLLYTDVNHVLNFSNDSVFLNRLHSRHAGTILSIVAKN